MVIFQIQNAGASSLFYPLPITNICVEQPEWQFLVLFADSIVTSGSAVAKIHSAIGFYQFSAIVSALSFIFGVGPLAA